MPQTALPDADDLTGGWTPTPLWSTLRGGSPVNSQSCPNNESFEVALDPLALTHCTPQILIASVTNSGADSATVTVALLQGSTTIASTNVTLSGATTQQVSLVLSQAQINSITDYTKLHVSVTANASCSITTACCANAFPATLTATLANFQGCACVSASISLVWNASTSKWEGTGTFGTGACASHQVTLKFYCKSGGTTCSDFALDVTFPDNCVTGLLMGSLGCTCSPISIRFQTSSDSMVNHCGCTHTIDQAAAFNVTITT